MKERPVYPLSNSTRRLDDFILSEAESNVDEFSSRWIVAASFDAFPVTDSLQLPLPLLDDDTGVRWSQVNDN